MGINVYGVHGTPGEDHLGGADFGQIYFMTADDFVTDMIDGGGGSDIVDYAASQVGLTITLTDPLNMKSASGGTVTATFEIPIYNPATHSYVDAEHDQVVANLTSIENANGSNYDDTLNGNSGANTLAGLGGNDTINGGTGNDIIIGGGGHDTMTGGAGHDTFLFYQASDGPMAAATIHDLDTITDFVRGDDKIDLSGLVNETAGHHALDFIGATGFTGVAGQVNAIFDGHGFLVQADLNGDGHADFQVLVSSTTAVEMHNPLVASDFLLHG
jgi:serralysin